MKTTITKALRDKYLSAFILSILVCFDAMGQAEPVYQKLPAYYEMMLLIPRVPGGEATSILIPQILPNGYSTAPNG